MHRLASFTLLISAVLSAAVVEAQSLRGSRASVELMYRQAVSHDLHFYETSAGVQKAVKRGEFVRLRDNAAYEVAQVSYPFVLPTTQLFLERLGRQYRAACGDRLVVTSAIRPKSMRLLNSSDHSVHPTGMAIDLRKPNDRRCLSWLRETLSHLDAAGLIEATEEFRPPHFHVAVFPEPYRRYVQGKGGGTKLAERSGGERKYQVRSGDSLWGIARRNSVSVEDLKRLNNLSSSRIRAGQVLVLP